MHLSKEKRVMVSNIKYRIRLGPKSYGDEKLRSSSERPKSES
jgi:hypothetical protein